MEELAFYNLRVIANEAFRDKRYKGEGAHHLATWLVTFQVSILTTCMDLPTTTDAIEAYTGALALRQDEAVLSNRSAANLSTGLAFEAAEDALSCINVRMRAWHEMCIALIQSSVLHIAFSRSTQTSQRDGCGCLIHWLSSASGPMP